MACTQLSMSGMLPAELYERLLSTLSHYSDDGSLVSIDDVLFTSSSSSTNAQDEVRLRCVHQTGRLDTCAWTMRTLSRLEPVRLTPDFAARIVVDVPLVLSAPSLLDQSTTDTATHAKHRDKACSFVTALGFVKGPTVSQRGVRFKRGQVDILVTQFVDEAQQVITPQAHLVTVSSQFALPRSEQPGVSSGVTNKTGKASMSSSTPGTPIAPAASSANIDVSAQSSRAQAEARIRETKRLLRGFVRLERGEP